MSYWLFVLPGIALALWAQFKVKTAYAHAKKFSAGSGLSGAEAALRILQRSGLSNVKIEQSHGFLSDHYDPKAKVLRLSNEVYGGRTLAALGIAAHEAGHAIQDAEGYKPLVIRNGIVPLASIGGNLWIILVIIGFAIGNLGLAMLGVALFGVVVVFQLVNLPVEFDASTRAKKILLDTGMISSGESKAVSGVLDAAALTYVAATVSAILTLVYYLVQLGVIGGNRD